MLITRYVDRHGRAAVGVERDGGIRSLTGVDSVGSLLRLPLAEIRALVEAAAQQPSESAAEMRRLPPVDSLMEVWAAGVTYERSRAARVLESDRAPDVYDLVYEAARPELFFKSVAWRVTGDGEAVAVRRDSEINVPEPELALVLNAQGEIVGYTVCDDVSSRSIEGANPLYLPQAKVYLGAVALGPGIRPAWEVADPYALGIAMRIERGGPTVWEGRTSTAELRRDLRDLAHHLLREEVFPDGVVLSTGTSLVPDLPFSLEAGDTIRISIEEVGDLASRVLRGRDDMAWLARSAHDPARPGPTLPAEAAGAGR